MDRSTRRRFYDFRRLSLPAKDCVRLARAESWGDESPWRIAWEEPRLKSHLGRRLHGRGATVASLQVWDNTGRVLAVIGDTWTHSSLEARAIGAELLDQIRVRGIESVRSAPQQHPNVIGAG